MKEKKRNINWDNVALQLHAERIGGEIAKYLSSQVKDSEMICAWTPSELQRTVRAVLKAEEGGGEVWVNVSIAYYTGEEEES